MGIKGRRERWVTFLSCVKKETKNLCVTRKPIELKWEAALPPRGRENSRVRIGASAIRPLEYFPFGRAAHALASSCAVRCPAGMVERGKPCAALSDGWLNAPTKRLLLEERLRRKRW